MHPFLMPSTTVSARAFSLPLRALVHRASKSTSICQLGVSRCFSSSNDKVVLRYFEYRGRAQALRYSLVDAGVAFKDDKIPISQIISGNWFNTKSNPAIAGQFGRLPVLEWNDFQITQNEAISRYLYHKLQHGAPDDFNKEALSASLTSLAHQDMIVMCLQLANNISQVPPEVDDKHLVRPVQELQVRLNGIILKLEEMLASKSHPFFTGDTPVMGDYFLYEALDVVTSVYGDEALNNCSHLETFVESMQQRPRLKAYLEADLRPGLLGTENEGEVMMRFCPSPCSAASAGCGAGQTGMQRMLFADGRQLT